MSLILGATLSSSLLRGGPGNDTLVGGPGVDTAVFTYPSNQYRVTVVGRFAVVEHNVAVIQVMPGTPLDGRDLLVDIEQVQFSNGVASIGAIQPEGIRAGFDARFYLLTNPDVAVALAAGTGSMADRAFAHWSTNGWREGRDPNAFFDTSAYLAANRDVAVAGIDPLAHYLGSGWREGRHASPDFNAASYLTANPDLRLAGVNPLDHYLNFGFAEGRPLG